MTGDELRALDAEVHTRVMGGTVIEYQGGFYDEDGTAWRSLPPYSADIAAAWEVVERMVVTAERLAMVVRLPEGGWGCRFASHVKVDAPTAPLAICLAALKAVAGSSKGQGATNAGV